MMRFHMLSWAWMAVALCAFAMSAASQQLPTGFADQTVATGFSQPAGFTFLPDGRVLLTEQRTARIKVVAGGTTATIGTVPNVNAAANERGLLGIDVHYAFPAQPYIYVYYSRTNPVRMVLSRFTVTGDLNNANSTNLSITDRYDIITDIPDNRSNHNGGTCRFGPDNMLYVSIGDDAANPCDAQSTGDLRGVILRVDISRLPAGAGGPPAKSLIVPAGNPFNGPTDNDRLTWAFGLRNPFRFNIDSLTGALYIADVGASSFEEFSEVKTGGRNLGWPWYEGTARRSNCAGQLPTNTLFPIAQYSHAGFGSLSIISFTRYRNVLGGAFNFGNAYEGDAFYSEYYQGFVRRLKETNNVWAPAPQAPGQPNATDWARSISTVGDALVGPDGAIYYLRQFPGQLRRVVYQPQLPTLTAPTTIPVGQPLLVRASRNTGDTMLIALSLIKINPTPLAGFFGGLELGAPTPVKIGNADAQGNLDFTINVPAIAGFTVHFQALAQVPPENYLSTAQSVTVTP